MKNNKGFTLIELLVVVLIIGILAAIALPQYFKAVEKSRAAEAFTVMGSVNHAQAVYHMAHPDAATAFTANFSDLDVDLPGASGSGYTTDNFTYTLTGSTSATARIEANRNGSKYDYTLSIGFMDGARCCKAGTGTTATADTAMCSALGLVNTGSCAIS